MKCIVVKPSHIQGFLCNFKIEGDISISFGKKWSWPPCTQKPSETKTKLSGESHSKTIVFDIYFSLTSKKEVKDLGQLF